MTNATARCLAPAILLLLPGCSPREAPPAPPAKTAPSEAQVRAARMDLDIAQQGLAAAEAELHAQELEGRAASGRLRRESELAAARLAQYHDVESARKLKECQLQLQKTQDQMEDSRDELEQLEKLYQGNDLADSTKEIVLKRGRRDLLRAGAAVALKEIELKTLRDDLIPTETGRMQLEADQKKDEADRAAQGADVQLRHKRIALARAQADVQKAQAALADLEKK